MRRLAVAGILLVVAACSQPTTVANVSPSARAASPTPAASTSAAPSCIPASSYGLVIAAGTLEVIDTCGGVKTSTPLAAPSVATCSAGVPAQLAAPVSATNDRIYYRDGDTKIRYLTLDGHTADATTVPGGPTTVSFFSVSPDDSRIAVAVEDLSAASTIGLRLYVEDVQGSTHHVDIYSTTVSKSGGTTLWPMGWHSGELVVAVMTACGPPLYGGSPVAWHVVDPATGNRLVDVGGSGCSGGSGLLSRWPSPSGVGCVVGFTLTGYRWDGTSFLSTTLSGSGNDVQSGFSSTGYRWFVAGETTGQYCPSFAHPPSTCVQDRSGNMSNWASAGGVACLFIDENHLLMPNGVTDVEGGIAAPIPFPTSATCAGRYPGGL